MKKIFNLLVITFLAAACTSGYDVCVYGGSSAAVTAAYSAAQMGRDVVIVSPDDRLGGLTTSGLGYTDIGNKQAVFGVAKQFYRKLGERYGRLESWIFEPSVALDVMEEYLDHPRITVLKGYRLEEIMKGGAEIKSITAVNDEGARIKVSASYFIDATYEGDLMARSGVSYHVGREDNSVYGEDWNGVQLLDRHQFPDGIDPYVEKGNPSSGLLWGISDAVPAPNGTGDGLSQAYNYRICLTDSLENMVPIEKPENYDPAHYELLLRLMEAQPDKRQLSDYFIWSMMPGRKTDVNNKGGFSTDMVGGNHAYPEASFQERQEIIQAHKDYTIGLLYFVGHDERVPASIREEMLKWGLPKDEYLETDHWTPQLYIRECRRMIGEYVATQKDCEQKTHIEDWVGMAAYTMDSHNCQRVVVVKDGVPMVKNEGNVEVKVGGPFPISYRSLTPKREECTNLLVPIALSASHIAYGSIRMEPVFMVLGQACGIATALADGIVQNADAAQIRSIMETDPYMDGSQADVIIDDGSPLVVVSEGWQQTKGRRGYGPTYYELKGDCTDAFVEYTLPDTLSGMWDIYCFQQLKDKTNPVMHYEIRIGEETYHKTFDRSEMKLVGQVSGEWFHLGGFELQADVRSVVNMYSDKCDLPLRADALLLVKK
ncbi:MAG: FAD-dependent oxidoreductase [Bacteroidales bacterium]|nr:FAD-dependent oxidoreductase [Bacteroidales bacterium]